jgi:hypothetical protein
MHGLDAYNGGWKKPHRTVERIPGPYLPRKELLLQYLDLKASTPYPPPAPEILINERTNHQVR